MNWELHKQKLLAGESVQFRPRGNSMTPRICSGNLVTVEPIAKHTLVKGDIVFCKVKGTYYVHLIESIQEKMGDRLYQIGNNHNHTNGTISESQVFGKVVQVAD
jgi:phage repressor protein C with HTH and peptisase S24 domain